MLEHVQGSFRGMALVRAAAAMIRSLGGEPVVLLFPAVALPDDPASQLGLSDPGVEQIEICPVIARNLRSETGGTRRRLEFLMPAQAVLSQIEARRAASPQAFFDAALGIIHDGVLLRIEKIIAEYFAGTAYLYRVIAVE